MGVKITIEEYENYLIEVCAIPRIDAHFYIQYLTVKLKNHCSFSSDKYVLWSLLQDAQLKGVERIKPYLGFLSDIFEKLLEFNLEP